MPFAPRFNRRPHALRAALVAFALVSGAAAAAPVKVWVALSDKGPAALPPASGAPAASLRGYEDRPVYAPYLAALAAAGFSQDAALKWQNRVSGRIEAARLAALRALPFVAGIQSFPRRARRAPLLPHGPLPWLPLAKRLAIDPGAAGPLYDSLGITRLHRWMDAAGMAPGRGMRVAFIDADFHLGSAIYSPMKARIKDQWDFAGHRARAVDDSLLDSHGAECMSLIGGNAPGTFAGAAPEAEFLLYRAEINDSELYAEEDYVAAGIERAVDSGAQVINISLGYRYDFDLGEPDIPYKELDGRTRPASLAATGAARRNVVVAIAMGNEADTHPGGPSLGTPADADSVLAVGIVDKGRRHCDYSSTGPAADHRVKPDVSSMGPLGLCAVAVANPESAEPSVAYYSGTSFAAPAVAAVVTLLRQLKPLATAEEVRQALMRTASRADAPDSLVGYGLIDAGAAAIRLGVPLTSALAADGHARLFHPNDGSPIFLTWDPERPRPRVELVDLSGRRVPVDVSLQGPILTLRPLGRLPTGVYIAHVP